MNSFVDLFLYAGAGGFVSGVLLSSFVRISPFWSLLIVASSFFVSLLARLSGRHKNRLIAGFIFFAITFSLGTIRFSAMDVSFDNKLAEFEKQRVGLVGTIIREPDERTNGTLLTLDNISIGIDGSGEKIGGRVLIRGPKYPAFHYGDQISVSGIIEKPEAFETGDGRMFDYESYLDRFGISHIINRPTINFISADHGNFVLAALFKTKQKLLKASSRVISSPESELLGGIIFGSQRGLSEEVSEDFRRAGLVHIVVLSGYNLSVVADWIMRATKFLPHSLGLSLGALSIVAYALMAGASATAVRAAIMALLVILAQASRRKYDVSRALILAGVAMIAVNPKVLVFDRSFQLSFLATTAVIYVSPLIEPKLKFVTERLGLRAIVASTLATNITVMPLILHMSGMLSLLSLPANILALPVVPAAMLLGMATSVIGLFGATLAYPFGLLTTALLSWIIRIASIFGSPSATLSLPPFPFAWVIAAYAIIGFVVIRAHQKRKKLTELNELFLTNGEGK